MNIKLAIHECQDTLFFYLTVLVLLSRTLKLFTPCNGTGTCLGDDKSMFLKYIKQLASPVK